MRRLLELAWSYGLRKQVSRGSQRASPHAIKVLGFFLVCPVWIGCQGIVPERHALDGTCSYFSDWDGLVFEAADIQVRGNLISGTISAHNIGIESIAYRKNQGRAVFHLKTTWDEVPNIPGRDALRARDFFEGEGLPLLVPSSETESVGILAPGESVSGHFVVRGIVPSFWFGIRVLTPSSEEEVCWSVESSSDFLLASLPLQSSGS